MSAAWNKGKAVGKKKPLSEDQINHLKSYLLNQNNLRDLALFMFQLETVLRSSDVIKLKVEDITDFNNRVLSEINIIQEKTKKKVKKVHIVVLSEGTTRIMEEYIKHTNKSYKDWLFDGYKGKQLGYGAHWYIWKGWCKILGVDPKAYATHSGRRTVPTILWEKTKDPKMLMEILGHSDMKSTTTYVGMDKKEAIAEYRKHYLGR